MSSCWSQPIFAFSLLALRCAVYISPLYICFVSIMPCSKSWHLRRGSHVRMDFFSGFQFPEFQIWISAGFLEPCGSDKLLYCTDCSTAAQPPQSTQHYKCSCRCNATYSLSLFFRSSQCHSFVLLFRYSVFVIFRGRWFLSCFCCARPATLCAPTASSSVSARRARAKTALTVSCKFREHSHRPRYHGQFRLRRRRRQ